MFPKRWKKRLVEPEIRGIIDTIQSSALVKINYNTSESPEETRFHLDVSKKKKERRETI